MRRTPNVDLVLAVIEGIPPGSVLTYRDVAELAETSSARGVGQILAHHGDEVPWWRVVNASGRPPPHNLAEALAHLREEHTPLGRDGARVDLGRARWAGTVSDPPGSLDEHETTTRRRHPRGGARS